MSIASTITSRGQVTIPVSIRRKFGLNEGDAVFFSEVDGQIVLTPVTAPVLATAGIFRVFATGEPLSMEEKGEDTEDAWAEAAVERDESTK